MKKKTILLLICVLCFNIADAQRKRDEKDPLVISVFNSLNISQGMPDYTNSDIRQYNSDDVELTYDDSDSGTFVIVEEEPIIVERKLKARLPSSFVSFGGGIRIAKKKSQYFHEISITKAFYSSSERYDLFEYKQIQLESKSIETLFTRTEGYTQKHGAFAFRYEFGKIFGNKKNRMRFGLSAGVEPSFYYSKMVDNTFYTYPVVANINTLEFSVNPMLAIKLSKKVFLDIKMINNILWTDIYSPVIEDNPTLTSSQQGIDKVENTPYYRLGATLQLRYVFHSPEKRRRKSANTSMDKTDN